MKNSKGEESKKSKKNPQETKSEQKKNPPETKTDLQIVMEAGERRKVLKHPRNFGRQIDCDVPGLSKAQYKGDLMKRAVLQKQAYEYELGVILSRMTSYDILYRQYYTCYKSIVEDFNQGRLSRPTDEDIKGTYPEDSEDDKSDPEDEDESNRFRFNFTFVKVILEGYVNREGRKVNRHNIHVWNRDAHAKTNFIIDGIRPGDKVSDLCELLAFHVSSRGMVGSNEISAESIVRISADGVEYDILKNQDKKCKDLFYRAGTGCVLYLEKEIQGESDAKGGAETENQSPSRRGIDQRRTATLANQRIAEQASVRAKASNAQQVKVSLSKQTDTASASAESNLRASVSPSCLPDGANKASLKKVIHGPAYTLKKREESKTNDACRMGMRSLQRVCTTDGTWKWTSILVDTKKKVDTFKINSTLTPKNVLSAATDEELEDQRVQMTYEEAAAHTTDATTDHYPCNTSRNIQYTRGPPEAPHPVSRPFDWAYLTNIDGTGDHQTCSNHKSGCGRQLKVGDIVRTMPDGGTKIAEKVWYHPCFLENFSLPKTSCHTFQGNDGEIVRTLTCKVGHVKVDGNQELFGRNRTYRVQQILDQENDSLTQSTRNFVKEVNGAAILVAIDFDYKVRCDLNHFDGWDFEGRDITLSPHQGDQNGDDGSVKYVGSLEGGSRRGSRSRTKQEGKGRREGKKGAKEEDESAEELLSFYNHIPNRTERADARSYMIARTTERDCKKWNESDRQYLIPFIQASDEVLANTYHHVDEMRKAKSKKQQRKESPHKKRKKQNLGSKDEDSDEESRGRKGAPEKKNSPQKKIDNQGSKDEDSEEESRGRKGAPEKKNSPQKKIDNQADPPKHPPNAFILFCKEYRCRVAKTKHGLTAAQLVRPCVYFQLCLCKGATLRIRLTHLFVVDLPQTAAAAAQWKATSDKDKKCYKEAAAKALEKYREEKKAYDERLGV